MSNNIEKLKFLSFAESPTPSEKWLSITNEQRESLVNSTLKNSHLCEYLQISRVEKSGEVFTSFLNPLSARDRGTFLLDLESLLKASIEESITVWCEPLGDKNSLRNLRGIEIKGSKYE